MTEVTVVQGSPGAGKTYTLRQIVEDKLKQGLKVEYRNFTRSGTRDTRRELRRELDVDRDDVQMDIAEDKTVAERITGTLHALAYRSAARHDMIHHPAQVIQPDDAPAWTAEDIDEFDRVHAGESGAAVEDVQTSGRNMYVAFCERSGLNYAVNPKTPMRAVLRDDNIDQHKYSTDGNAVFAAFEWAKMNYGPEVDRSVKARKAPVDLPVPGSRVEELYNRWEAYKDDQFRFEHSDYIDAVIQHGWAPNVDVLCVDEFQDLSPLEHKLLWEWIEQDALSEVYLAGDVNQSIYSFRGAHPAFMAEMREGLDNQQVQVLSESRRCADEIADLADSLISGLDGAVRIAAHDSTPRGRVGEIHVDGFDGLADVVAGVPRDESVLVLTRTNKVAAAAADALRDAGVMFRVLGSNRRDAWAKETAVVVGALSRLKAGEAIADQQVEAVFDDKVSAAVLDEGDAGGSVGAVAAKDVWSVVGYESVGEIISDMAESSVWERRVRAAVGRGQRRRDNVRVGTVHSAKGLEADRVYLLDAYPSGVAERYGSDEELSAEERRVAYVAATRAKDEFEIVRGVRGDAPRGHREQWPTFRSIGGGESA